jgi:hypothetical protein
MAAGCQGARQSLDVNGQAGSVGAVVGEDGENFHRNSAITKFVKLKKLLSHVSPPIEIGVYNGIKPAEAGFWQF